MPRRDGADYARDTAGRRRRRAGERKRESSELAGERKGESSQRDDVDAVPSAPGGPEFHDRDAREYGDEHQAFDGMVIVNPGPTPSAPTMEDVLGDEARESCSFPSSEGMQDHGRGQLRGPEDQKGIEKVSSSPSETSAWWSWVWPFSETRSENKDTKETKCSAAGGEQHKEEMNHPDKTCSSEDSKSEDSNHIECPICFEDIDEAKAVGRCSGDHGQQHLFHAHCLGEWISRSANDAKMSIHGPRCPVCRGSVQIHAERLRSRIQGPDAKRIDPQSRDFFQALLGKLGATENGWTNLVTVRNVATVAKAATAAAAIAHGFNAGWRMDIQSLFTTHQFLKATESIEGMITDGGEGIVGTETLSGGLRILHLGAGVVGMGVRIGNVILRLSADSEKDKKEDSRK